MLVRYYQGRSFQLRATSGDEHDPCQEAQPLPRAAAWPFERPAGGEGGPGMGQPEIC